MELIKKLLKKYKSSTKKTNKFWILSCDIAKLTKTTPNRWLRDCKNHWDTINRAIIEFKEAREIKNKVALFIWLFKKHKNFEEKSYITNEAKTLKKRS